MKESTLPAVSYKQVSEASRSFKSRTAAGSSGLRAEHLKEAKGQGEGWVAEALRKLTLLVNVTGAG